MNISDLVTLSNGKLLTPGVDLTREIKGGCVAELMSDKPLGAFCVENDKNELLGVVTEGDLRRAIAQSKDMQNQAATMMHRDPITLAPEMILDEAITFLESKRKVNTAPVIENGKLLGLVQLHDLV